MHHSNAQKRVPQLQMLLLLLLISLPSVESVQEPIHYRQKHVHCS